MSMRILILSTLIATAPGTTPGAAQGTAPSVMPGNAPDTTPGTAPGSAAEEEEASPIAKAIAATIVGGLSINLAMLHLMNHHEEDMRRYTYEIINATVSVFSALLMFQTIDDWMETLLEGKPVAFGVLLAFVHMFFWYLVLHVSLFHICVRKRPQILDEASIKEGLEAIELDKASVAIILAHFTGFASIKAWGSLQQLEYFNTPVMSIAVLPISFCGQFVTRIFLDRCREWMSLFDDDYVDPFEKDWDSEIVACETDIMALTLSFNFIQAARFISTGNLPNAAGQISWHEGQEQRMTGRQFWLYAIGWCCACVMLALFISEGAVLRCLESKGKIEKKPEEAEEKEEQEKDEDEEEEEEGQLTSLQQAFETAILTMSQSFAWSVFYGTQIWLTAWPELADPMISSFVLTSVITITSLSSIRLLEKVETTLNNSSWRAHHRRISQSSDYAIKQLIKAIAILIGFGWEKCFDDAVISLTSGLSYKHTAKVLLAVLSVAILVPAWRWYLLPMSMKEGWKFGFVVGSRKDFGVKFTDVLLHLNKKKDKHAVKRDDSGALKCDDSGLSPLHSLMKERSPHALPRQSTTPVAASALATEGFHMPSVVPYVELPAGEDFNQLQQQQLELVRKLQAAWPTEGNRPRDDLNKLEELTNRLARDLASRQRLAAA